MNKLGRPRTYKVGVHLRMTRGMHDYLKKMARDENRTISAIVVEAVYQFHPTASQIQFPGEEQFSLF